MVQFSKKHNKNPRSSRAADLPADDLHTHEELDLVQDPFAGNLTLAEREHEFQQRLLNMESIL